jgi:general secretion pathway protein K
LTAVGGRKGIASLLVLWALLLLGTMATAFSLAMRTEAQAARNGYDEARAYYLARSGIDRVIAMLAAMPPDNVAGAPIEGQSGDGAYVVRLERETGKIDLNGVPEPLLKALLRNAGLPEAEAEALGDAILDWRDADDDRRPQGAEASEYAKLPEPIRPRNGPIASIGELQSVSGMPPAFFDAFVSRAFTTHGSGGGSVIDVNAAPPELLRAMPGIAPELAAAIVERRSSAPLAGPADLLGLPGGDAVGAGDLARFSYGTPARAFTVVSTGRAGENGRRTVSCLVDIGGIGDNPVRMFEWNDRVGMREE